jgi:hypothetical protein
MQQNVANKQQLELGLEALKDRVVQARQQAQQPPQRPAQTDPVEMVASQLTPASAKWVRAHPEFATDDEKKNEMIAAHYKAAAKKIKADTPEYFAFIEETLGLDSEQQREAPKPAPRQPAPPPPAPARGNGGGNRPGTMTLSAHQREAAKLAGLTDEEYAQNLVSLRKEGRIGTTH